MRPGDPAQQIQDRQADGHGDAVEHAEDQHRHGRGQGEQELAPPEPGQAAELRDLDQPGRRVDHHSAQGRGGEGGQQRAQEQHRQQDRAHRHQRVQLGPASDRVRQHRATPAAADREALEQAGRHIGRAKSEELLVGVDRLPAFGGERPSGHHVVGIGHDGDSECRRQQRRQVDPAQIGERRLRQSAGDVADRGHAAGIEVEQGHGSGREEHGDQRSGDARKPALTSQQQHEHGGRHDQGGELDLVEVSGRPAHLVHDRVAPHRDAGHLAELADDHQDGDAGHVADQHRA